MCAVSKLITSAKELKSTFSLIQQRLQVGRFQQNLRFKLPFVQFNNIHFFTKSAGDTVSAIGGRKPSQLIRLTRKSSCCEMFTKHSKYNHVSCHSVATYPSLVSNWELGHTATGGNCSLLQPLVQFCLPQNRYMSCTDVFSKKLPSVFARDKLYSTVVMQCKIVCSNCGYRQRGGLRRRF